MFYLYKYLSACFCISSRLNTERFTSAVGISILTIDCSVNFTPGVYFSSRLANEAIFFYLHVTPMLPTEFQVNWIFGSDEAKIDFPYGRHGGHLWFSIGTISFTLDLLVTPPWRPSYISHWNVFCYFFVLQVTPMLPTKFQVSWTFGSGEEAKNRFSGLLIGTILAIFDLHLYKSAQWVKWPSGVGETGF